MKGVCSSRIIGTGSCVPKRVVTNEAIGRSTGMSAPDIVRRTGIHERRWVSDGETSSTLGAVAARHAIESSGLSPSDLDAVIVSTTSPDIGMVPTACLIQQRLGLGPIPAFDMAASCSGFLAALSIADGRIRSGEGKNVLVVAAEVKSRFLDTRDASTAILFGDGAGAVVLGASAQKEGVLSIRLQADGSRWELIRMPGGGSGRPLTQAGLTEGIYSMKMSGQPLYRAAMRTLTREIARHLKESGMKIEMIDHWVLHQANARMIAKLSKDLGLPPDKVIGTIHRLGNTSSSSIPIALDTAVRAGRIRRGDLILTAAFGGGLTWGTALIRW